MALFQRAAPITPITGKQPSVQPGRWLIRGACILELLYLLLIVSSSISELPLSSTPLVPIWSQLLPPSQFPLSLIETLLMRSTWLSPLLMGLLLFGLIATYICIVLAALRMKSPQQIPRRYLYHLLGGVLLFGLTLLLMPRIFSDDVFNSMFSGRIFAVYGADPLNNAPIQFQYFDDPYLTWVTSGRTSHNIYGALWLFVAIALAVVNNIPLISLFLFKGLALLLHLLNCVLIWKILGRLAPQRRFLGTLLYGWSPLTLIELAGNGHNEGLLMCLLLLATWLCILLNERMAEQALSKNVQELPAGPSGRSPFWHRPWFLRLSMLLAISLAGSVNLIALLVAPLYIWFNLRTERSSGRIVLGFSWRLLVVLLPMLLLMLPFWRGADTFFSITSAVDMAHFVYSPINVLAAPLRSVFLAAAGPHLPPFLNPALAADATVRASATFIFILIYARRFSKIRHAQVEHNTGTPTPHDLPAPLAGFDTLLSSSAIAIFSYMLLVSGWFWPWYILWLFWLVALRRLDTLTSTILILSCSALFIYTFVGFSRTPLATYQTAVIFGIPLVYLVVVKSRERYIERTRNTDARRS